MSDVLDQVIFCPKGKVILRHVADEVLLVPVRGTVADMDKLFVLEGIGETVWKLMDGTRSLREIEDALSRDFDESVEGMRKDLVEFVESLKMADLIEEKSHV